MIAGISSFHNFDFYKHTYVQNFHSTDNQEIANAVSKQKLVSEGEYKADFKKNVLGKAPHNVGQAYPQYEHLRNVSKMTSQVTNYL